MLQMLSYSKSSVFEKGGDLSHLQGMMRYIVWAIVAAIVDMKSF
jgi:hypothetical protein